MPEKEQTQIAHIAFIMDGNRRWAKRKGLPKLLGHKKGYENLKTIADACFDRGIAVATFFAFSTENWNRSKTEVTYLLALLGTALNEEVARLNERGIRVRFIGDLSGFAPDLEKRMRDTMALTAENTKGILNVAVNYGGRAEILAAVKKLIASGARPKDITEERFSESLTTAGLPDPDLVIRTSGEQRLSGFLAWQSVYSELLFTKKMWPEFSERDLDVALAEYADRERRFGA